MGLKLNIILLAILAVGGFLVVYWLACQTGYLQDYFSCPFSPLEIFWNALKGS